MRRWILALAASCGSLLALEIPEQMKVSGGSNPFEVYELSIMEQPAIYAADVSVLGKVWNSGAEKHFKIRFAARVTPHSGKAFDALISIDALGADEIQNFFVGIPGIKKKDQIKAIEFVFISAVSAAENERARKRQLAAGAAAAAKLREEEAATRKRQADREAEVSRVCQALRAKIGGKALSSLTVNEADLRDSCRAARLW